MGGQIVIVDDRALLIVIIVISLLSLLTNIVALSVILNLRPFLERFGNTMAGVEKASSNWERVGQELLKAIAILVDRTSRPNE